MTLKEFACGKSSTPKRGSLARISEHLGVAKGTVKKWISGEWQPSLEKSQRIQDMIHARIDLSPRNYLAGRPRKTKTETKLVKPAKKTKSK